ncbi:MAG: hypothetical protein KKA60_05720 [Proteobacteria bacterium]|nr:hypothetical protein [Pseudomonadota bacterium]
MEGEGGVAGWRESGPRIAGSRLSGSTTASPCFWLQGSLGPDPILTRIHLETLGKVCSRETWSA